MTKKRTNQDVQAELQAVNETLARLAEEEASTPDKLKRAADASRSAWEQAAITGEPIATSSAFARTTARVEELPGILWAARLRALALRIEFREIDTGEADHAEAEAVKTAGKLRPRFERLRDELSEAESDAAYHRMEARETRREIGEIRRELSALEHRGPDSPKRQSSLLPRPNIYEG